MLAYGGRANSAHARDSRRGQAACEQIQDVPFTRGQANSVSEPSPWFAVEGGNWRAALSTSLRERPDRALVMAVAIWRSWMARGLHAEGLRWLAEALEACPAPSALRARALFATAVLEVRLGRPWRGPAIGAEIAALARDPGDPGSLAEALHQQSLLAWMAGEWDDAVRLASKAANAARGMARVRASHEHLRAVMALFRGETSAAQALLDKSLSAGGPYRPGTHPGATRAPAPQPRRSRCGQGMLPVGRRPAGGHPRPARHRHRTDRPRTRGGGTR